MESEGSLACLQEGATGASSKKVYYSNSLRCVLILSPFYI